MVNLNLPTLQNAPNQGILQPSIDNSVLQPLEQIAQSRGDLINKDLRELNNATMELRRANIIASETQHQADLALSESLNAVQQSVLGAINSVAIIDEARRREEQAKTDRVYTLNSALGMQSDYQATLQDAISNSNPDGSGFTEGLQGFINDNIRNYMENAPSEDAKLMVYESLSKFKIDALSKAFDQEADMRIKYRIGVAAQSVDFLANQVRTDPTKVGIATAQLNDITQLLQEQGIDKATVDKFEQGARSTLIDNQVKGVLNGSDPTLAMNILGSESVKAQLSTPQYNQLLDYSYTAISQWNKQQAEEADKALLLQAYTTNKLPQGISGYDKAADMAAAIMLFNPLGDTSQATADNIPQIASSIASFFKTYNSGMGGNTKDTLVNKLTASENPFEITAYATGLAALINDPSGNNAAVIKNLPEVVQTKVARIANLTSFGIDAKNAVDIVNKEMEAAKNPAMNAFNSSIDVDSRAKSMVSSVLQGFFEYGASDYSKAKVKEEAAGLYSSYLLKYKDENLAEQATRKSLAFKYANTEINSPGIFGDREFMEAAPDLYYKGAVMDEFKAGLEVHKKMAASIVGLKENDIVIQPIPGWTITENPSQQKTYALVDKSTGMRLVRKNEIGVPEYINYKFTINQTAYGAEMKKVEEALIAQRAEINRQSTDLQNQIINRYTGLKAEGAVWDEYPGVKSTIKGAWDYLREGAII